MSAPIESLVDLHDASISDKDDVDSLPSESTDDLYSEADSDAQAEWERSLEQLQLILTMILVPWMGKYFGRKFAYWSMPLFSLITADLDTRVLTNDLFRLGAIHGMGSQRRRSVDEQEGVQGCWCSRGSCDSISTSHGNC